MRLPAYRTRPRVFLSLLLAFGVVEGCASLSSKDEAAIVTPSLRDGGVGTGVIVDGSRPELIDGASAAKLNPLCGLVGFCFGHAPDEPAACAQEDAGVGVVGHPGRDAGGSMDARADATVVLDGATDATASRDGATLDGGVSGNAKDAAEPSAPGARDAGATLHRTLGTSGGAAPPPYSPTPEVDAGALFSCQVTPADNGQPTHECVPAGARAVGDSCTGSHDCRAGLACVGTAGAGQCQPYCCQIPAACAPQERADGGTTPTYCAERPLLDGRGSVVLPVPVCVPAEQCHLDCVGEGCMCPGGTTCAVVLPDGTTGCVAPGKGRGGDACPTGACAPGYFCSAAKVCIKTCKPGVTDATCDPGKCQAAAGLPEGFGLCVSATPASR